MFLFSKKKEKKEKIYRERLNYNINKSVKESKHSVHKFPEIFKC